MVFLQSLESILPVIILISLGYILQIKKWFDISFSDNISKLIMNIALPASIFVSVMEYLTVDRLIKLSSGLVYVALATIFGYIIAYILVKALKIRAGRRGTFINTFVNANTIFIGLPLNIALFGDKATEYFLVYYIINTISTWTLGIYLMTTDSQVQSKTTVSFDWKKLLPPPLIGFLVAIIFLLAKIPVPQVMTKTLTYVGNIVTPLSLIYIGIVLAKAGLASVKFDKDSVYAFCGRFLIAPLLMMIVLKTIGTNLPNLEAQTFMLQSAVSSLAVMPILAHQGNGDVEYATNIVTLSTVLLVVVIPSLMSIMQLVI
jgi:malate permease